MEIAASPQLPRNLRFGRCGLDMPFGDRIDGADDSKPSYSGWWQ